MEINNLSRILQLNNAIRKFKIRKIANASWPIETCLIQKNRLERGEWEQFTKQNQDLFYKKHNLAGKWVLCLLRWRACFEFNDNYWWI